MMRKTATALGVVSLVSGLGVGVASAGPHGTDRPFHCSGQGTTSFNLSVIPHVISGTNTAHCTHLGLTTESFNGTFAGSPTSTVYTGTAKAANGDELDFTVVSTAVPTSVTSFRFTNEVTYDGGTGRFQDARGSSTATGTLVQQTFTNPFAFAQTFTESGTISY